MSVFVTFHTPAWGRVTLAGEIAIALLKLAGHSGTVPGAILGRDVPAALARLERGLAAGVVDVAGSPPVTEDGEDAAPVVAVPVRAFPLLQLLAAAGRASRDVMWEEGVPLL